MERDPCQGEHHEGPGAAGGRAMTASRGPRLRTDIVDVYLARRVEDGFEFLQLRRREAPLAGTWQPVMGHIEERETALAAAVRELHEECALRRDDPRLLGLWALEQVHPYFLAD